MPRTATPRTKEELFAEQQIQLEIASAKLDAARAAVLKAMKRLRDLSKADKATNG